jgi:hypothetical protein
MWLIPVTRGWRSQSDLEAHALGASLNRLSEVGGWDDSELAVLLEELAESPAGLDGLGWTTGDLDDRLADLAPPDPAPAPESERQVHGLREVALKFSTAEHQEWGDLLAVLRRSFKLDGTPAVVLEAMRRAVPKGRKS